MQSARTSQMLVDVPSAVEFFSSFTRLAPRRRHRDRHAGRGRVRPEPPVWMQPGDVIEVTVEGVGTIRNRIVAEEGAPRDWRWRPGTRRETHQLDERRRP